MTTPFGRIGGIIHEGSGCSGADSPEWKALYGLRQAIERVFKGMKQSRRLETHTVQGLKHVALHCSMSTLVFQATALVRFRRSGVEGMCWQVRKIA